MICHQRTDWPTLYAIIIRSWGQEGFADCEALEVVSDQVKRMYRIGRTAEECTNQDPKSSLLPLPSNLRSSAESNIIATDCLSSRCAICPRKAAPPTPRRRPFCLFVVVTINHGRRTRLNQALGRPPEGWGAERQH
jgi:hypothetical protein